MSLISGATLSSLQAQSRTIAVSATNVANVRSLGVQSDGSDPTGQAYVPQRVVQTSGTGGAVLTRTVDVTPASVQIYAPGDPNADAGGFVPQANVSLEEEFVVQIQAKIAYKANLAALETQSELLGDLLDVAT